VGWKPTLVLAPSKIINCNLYDTPFITLSQFSYTFIRGDASNFELTAQGCENHRLPIPPELIYARQLHQCICNIMKSVNFIQYHISIFYNVSNTMVSHINMVCLHMKGHVLFQIYGTFTITLNYNSSLTYPHV
jgi:hypothetical protein